MEGIARAARAMATGFRLGGKLIVFGGAGTDAAHIAVEFMHPVIVGKRALPAVALSNGAPTAGRPDDETGGGNGDDETFREGEGFQGGRSSPGGGNLRKDRGFQGDGDLLRGAAFQEGEGSRENGRSPEGEGSPKGGAEVFAHQVRHWADAADTALGISRDGRCPSVLRGLEAAGELGLLTIALTGRASVGHTLTGHTSADRTSASHASVDHTYAGRLPADHVLVAASDDPAVVKEVHVTAYHLLWELVHVFLDRLGPAGRGVDR
ncbi:hypothetical protein [Streptosporangium sp. NPDC002524]|uniref:hypothetical protein n=1 Tax=Streptosporangium sp. NPDC002524 TaxID=3154537 RepID=UPI0033248FDD